MNKHKTLAYIKYGKLISEINDKITDQTVKSDMIKFLIKFPGNLIYPYIYQLNYSEIFGRYKFKILISEKYGRFKFEITKPSTIIFIDFPGKNNFHIWTYNKWLFNNSDFLVTWISIDDIERYVKLYHNDFNNIIE